MHACVHQSLASDSNQIAQSSSRILHVLTSSNTHCGTRRNLCLSPPLPSIPLPSISFSVVYLHPAAARLLQTSLGASMHLREMRTTLSCGRHCTQRIAEYTSYRISGLWPTIISSFQWHLERLRGSSALIFAHFCLEQPMLPLPYGSIVFSRAARLLQNAVLPQQLSVDLTDVCNASVSWPYRLGYLQGC